MAPAESLELAELVADLTAVIDVVAPAVRTASFATAGEPVAAALAAFERAWIPPADGARLVDLSRTVAAAGMALVEGDPVTVRRLIAPASGAVGAA